MWISTRGSKSSKVFEFETSRHWHQVGGSVGHRIVWKRLMTRKSVEFWMSSKGQEGDFHEATRWEISKT